MNKDRRKRIEALIEKIDDIKIEIEEIQSEEQDAFDNMPESFQDGERGEQSQSAIDALGEALGALDETIDQLNTASE